MDSYARAHRKVSNSSAILSNCLANVHSVNPTNVRVADFASDRQINSRFSESVSDIAKMLQLLQIIDFSVLFGFCFDVLFISFSIENVVLVYSVFVVGVHHLIPLLPHYLQSLVIEWACKSFFD